VLLLSAGNTNDITMAHALVEAAGPFQRLLADRGYDADHLRKRLAERKAEAVIPTTTSRKTPIPYDAVAYRQRNTVERLWARLKDYRRVATRATTSSPTTSSPACLSQQPSATGPNESGP
jgi:transposase